MAIKMKIPVSMFCIFFGLIVLEIIKPKVCCLDDEKDELPRFDIADKAMGAPEGVLDEFVLNC